MKRVSGVLVALMLLSAFTGCNGAITDQRVRHMPKSDNTIVSKWPGASVVINCYNLYMITKENNLLVWEDKPIIRWVDCNNDVPSKNIVTPAVNRLGATRTVRQTKPCGFLSLLLVLVIKFALIFLK